MFRALKGLAGKEGTVTDRRIAKWAERNHRLLKTWEKNLLKQSVRKFSEENYVESYKKKLLFLKSKQYRLTTKGKNIKKNIYKYVNYLYDFSLLEEQEAVNVLLWGEIMIWAAYFDITDVVTKQFEKIYPQYREETTYKKDDLRRTRNMAAAVEASRRKGERRKRREERRRHRGEGGTASRRGGGSSYGGSRGGGIR